MSIWATVGIPSNKYYLDISKISPKRAHLYIRPHLLALLFGFVCACVDRQQPRDVALESVALNCRIEHVVRRTRLREIPQRRCRASHVSCPQRHANPKPRRC